MSIPGRSKQQTPRSSRLLEMSEQLPPVWPSTSQSHQFPPFLTPPSIPFKFSESTRTHPWDVTIQYPKASDELTWEPTLEDAQNPCKPRIM
ncbi:GM19239 [Drosophila sechellia]|uniref:GM19239 n=1 Tax=Drosophila sechellia TaxID=7238 RepID=B4I9Y1_DROSE|nr:GM19239 [Drosophila sechellia]